MDLLKNISAILVLVIIMIIVLTGCNSTQIIDLVHKDTGNFLENNDLTDSALDQYKVNNILFVPYTIQNPEKDYSQRFSTYSLKLATFMQSEGDVKVTINQVTIEPAKEIKFDKVIYDTKQILEFDKSRSNKTEPLSDVILINEINNHNMELNESSQLKVILSIRIEENEHVTTKDLIYVFDTKIRNYLVQR